MKRLILTSLLFAFTAMAVAEPKPSTDLVAGTWALNITQTAANQPPTYTSQIRTYSQSERGVTLVVKSTMPDGAVNTITSTYQYDGKRYPISGNPASDGLSAKQIDAHTAEFVIFKADMKVGMTRRTVSKDGKKLVVTETIISDKGKAKTTTLTFDRQ
jgi:hypothetical protein